MITTNYILIINVNLNTARDIKEFVNLLYFAKTNLEEFLLGKREVTSAFEKTPMDARSLSKLRGFVRNIVLELENRCHLSIEELNANDMSNYSFSFSGDEAFSFQTLCQFLLEVLNDQTEQTQEEHSDFKYFENVFNSLMEFMITANPYGGGDISEAQFADYEAKITDVNKMDFDRDFPSLQYDQEIFPDIVYDKNEE